MRGCFDLNFYQINQIKRVRVIRQSMKKQISETLNKLKDKFSYQYQDRLAQIILFGSQARNDAESESDIDLLIILKEEVNPVLEIKKNNSWICDLCLETDELINCIYISEKQFQTQSNPLLRNIKKEGIVVFTPDEQKSRTTFI